MVAILLDPQVDKTERRLTGGSKQLPKFPSSLKMQIRSNFAVQNYRMPP
jgi:hypothetical protein